MLSNAKRSCTSLQVHHRLAPGPRSLNASISGSSSPCSRRSTVAVENWTNHTECISTSTAFCYACQSRCRGQFPPLPPSMLASRPVVAATVDRTTGGRPLPPLAHQTVADVVALVSRAMLTDAACRSPMLHATHRRRPPMSQLWLPLTSHADARYSRLTLSSTACCRSRLMRSQPLLEIETLIPRVWTAFIDVWDLGRLRWCG